MGKSDVEVLEMLALKIDEIYSLFNVKHEHRFVFYYVCDYLSSCYFCESNLERAFEYVVKQFLQFGVDFSIRLAKI